MSTYWSSTRSNNYTTGNTEGVFHTNVPFSHQRPTCGSNCGCRQYGKTASEKAVPGYDYMDFLGKGRYGAVHLYKNRSTRKTVAIKSLSYCRNGQCTFQKVQSEYEIVKYIVHPNITRYYGFYTNTEHQMCYLVMEYASCGSLQNLLDEQRSKNELFTKSNVLKMLRDIIMGVQFLNSKNVIHCDLKPSNILCGDDNLLKISDFGLAHSMDNGNINVNYSDSTAYIAPEQLSGGKSNEKTEIWAIGFIAYEMATLKHPYGMGLTKAALQQKVRYDRFKPLHQLYGYDLQHLVEIMLNSKPECRGTLSSILRNQIFDF